MYLGIKRPWDHRVATVASDGPPVVIVPADAGTRPRVKKKRHPAAGPGGAGTIAHGDDLETDPDPVDLGPTTVTLSAADRALEWRGDDTQLPAQTIDMAGGGEARPLDDGEIGAAINGQGGAVRDCIVQGATGTDLKAAITVKIVVDGRGRPTRSRVQAPHYLFEHGLLGCTQRAVGHLHFPATGAPTLVTFPLTLG
jgi:hypothetical protein